VIDGDATILDLSFICEYFWDNFRLSDFWFRINHWSCLLRLNWFRFFGLKRFRLFSNWIIYWWLNNWCNNSITEGAFPESHITYIFFYMCSFNISRLLFFYMNLYTGIGHFFIP